MGDTGVLFCFLLDISSRGVPDAPATSEWDPQGWKYAHQVTVDGGRGRECYGVRQFLAGPCASSMSQILSLLLTLAEDILSSHGETRIVSKDVHVAYTRVMDRLQNSRIEYGRSGNQFGNVRRPPRPPTSGRLSWIRRHARATVALRLLVYTPQAHRA